MTKKMLDNELVDLTPQEQAEYDERQISGAAESAAQEVVKVNSETIHAAVETRMAQIRTARTALVNGTIFGAFTPQEKAVIDGLLQNDLHFSRIVLTRYDGTS